jgi:hypothetical protein
MPVLAARPEGVIIDTHIHLFDQKKFPYHPQATYKPPDRLLEDYTKFVREVKLNGSVIVHPEPYQDDHTYLEYAFAHEPWPQFFRGTCLGGGMAQGGRSGPSHPDAFHPLPRAGHPETGWPV